MPEGYFTHHPLLSMPSLCYLTTGLPVIIPSLVFLPLIFLSIHFRALCHLALPPATTFTAHIPYRLPSALIRSWRGFSQPAPNKHRSCALSPNQPRHCIFLPLRQAQGVSVLFLTVCLPYSCPFPESPIPQSPSVFTLPAQLYNSDVLFVSQSTLFV